MSARTHCAKCGTKLVPRCNVPDCHAPVETYSRIVGYLRPITTWNAGKQQEWKERTEYEGKKAES